MRVRALPTGLSLLELLIVISIIALLVQLSIPAIQNSRAASRKTVCANHLRGLGVASLAAHSAQGHFPAGGWTWEWVGDPTRGSGPEQPGGWVYNVLPYCEQQAIHDLGLVSNEAERRERAAEMEQLAIAEFHCPSRRTAQPYPRPWTSPTKNSMPTRLHARSDFAGNGGDIYTNLGRTPKDYREADSGKFIWDENVRAATGIFAAHSTTRLAQVLDGTSRTYLIGEKYLSSANYENGHDDGDDFTMYQGDDMDIVRWTMPLITDQFKFIFKRENEPRQDDPEFATAYAFGSAHPNGWNVVLCDGAVRTISYAVDPRVHQRLGNRMDGEEVRVPD